jgi:uncharacterized membrane protein
MVLSYINALNNNKYFTGLVLLTLNLLSRFVPIKLTKNQKKLLQHNFFKQVIIFSIAFSVTRDIVLSILVTAAFHILATHLFNENSKLCILPEHMKRLHSAIDTDGDNHISEEEIQNALKILEEAKKSGQSTNIDAF